ncbi:MAG TPA: sugar ABC transporter ATP-binding protein [Acetobacteraceae bacterium]|nr:sugar ABC transporter ATP-binding protein [Acetobacteraceae bacterium]
MDAAPQRSPVLEIRAIGKRYGATVALHDVSFELAPGEVCGLLGENGAGKSTLVKALSGVITPDTGEMRLAAAPYHPHDINDARRQGVATAFQELSLVVTLSVALNLFLPRPTITRARLVPVRRLEQEAERILRAHGVTDIDPARPVGDLPLGQRQRVEIVRAMHRNPRLLLLDEPTAALADREWLFALVQQAVARGGSVLYISHKLDEIRRLCRRCVILRNGRKVLDSVVAAMRDEDIFRSMAGRSAVEQFAPAPSAIRAQAAPALRAERLAGDGVEEISFTLASGEILGVAGLEGHGQSALFKSLVGLHPLRGGRIEIDGRPRGMRSPRAARAAGVVLVPEERKTEGIFKDLATAANISLPVIERASPLHLLHRRRERTMVARILPAVDLATRYLPRNIAALSGGNQQKAVLARALIAQSRCLLLFDPTRGVDVGAKQSIYRMMRGFVGDGGAILFYSTELDELVHLCDRCIVLYRGRVIGEVAGTALSQEHILSLAAGHAPRRTGGPEQAAG